MEKDTNIVGSDEQKNTSSQKNTDEKSESKTGGMSGVGEASFEHKKNNKVLFGVAVVAVLVVGVTLLARGAGLLFSNTSYVNPINGYSYTYSEGLQLVADGNMPPELVEKGIKSMAELNLMSGDSLLVKNTGVKEDGKKGDNVVYTVLDLSSRSDFVSFDDYTNKLFASFDEAKAKGGIDYERRDAVVGDGITSIEYSFEMNVPIDRNGNTRTGVFYDNIFQMEDGSAYSISFGYPKDIQDPEMYLQIYRDLLKSFKPGTKQSPAS